MIALLNNETQRLKALANYDLSYDELHSRFDDLTLLASRIAGTKVSLINLLDAYNQWTIAQQHTQETVIAVERSVCQYTIQQEDSFEVHDLAADDRFKDLNYISENGLRYYYGIPLRTQDGHAIGALCVLDKEVQTLSNDQKEMLVLIGRTIIERLDQLKQQNELKNRIRLLENEKRMVAHDIRGPVSGIIGLAELVNEQGNDNEMDEVLQYMQLIQQSGRSIIELADDILQGDGRTPGPGNELITLNQLKEKVCHLFDPRLKDKGINFRVGLTAGKTDIPFSKKNLMQIIGNLLSNAIKFTNIGGTISLNLALDETVTPPLLSIIVEDTGIGMSAEQVAMLIDGTSASSDGTCGEVGFGLGLGLVRQLVGECNGSVKLRSAEGTGSVFTINLQV